MASGALSPRDIELIFKAQTRGAARDVNTLGAAVKDLRTQVTQQAAESAKGVDVIDDLKASYKELTSALSEVKDNYALLTKLQGAESAEAKQAERVATLTERYEKLSQQVAAAEQPTKRLVNQQEAAGRALENAKAKLDGYRAATAQAAEAFEKAGGDSKNLAASQAQLIEQTKEIARGVNEVENALDGYGAAARKAASDAATLKDKASFDDLAKGSNLPTAQIEYIRQQEGAYKLLQNAIAEAAQQKRTFDAAIESAAVKSASDSARVLSTSLADVEQRQARIAQDAAFAKIANDAIESANNVRQFKASLDGAQASATTLENAIRAIINPTAEAVQTLAGATAQLDAAADKLNSPKKLRTSEYQDALNSSEQAGAALVRQGARVQDYKDQQVAVDAATAAFKRQQAAVLDLAEEIQRSDARSQEMIDNLRREETELGKVGAAMKVEEERLQALGAALRKAGVDTDNLAAHEAELVKQAQRAAANIQGLSEKTGKVGGGGLFGLKPYELQNLGYQVNDVVTSLASGQRPLQVLAQQGGQIAQIFPGAARAILANLGPLSAVAAAALVAYAAFKKLNDEAQATKTANAIVAQLGTVASGTTAPALAGVIGNLQDLGVKAKDAKPLLVDLLTQGFDTKTIAGFVDQAKVVSQVTGEDIPTSIKTMAEAFDGSYESVAKLDDKMNFLTADQREQIRTMYEHGDATGATQRAIDLFAARMDAARQPTNQLTLLVHNIEAAFGALVSTLGRLLNIKTGISDFFHNAGVGANYLLLRLRGVSAEQARIAAVQGREVNQQGQAVGVIAPRINPRAPTKAGADYLHQLKQEADANADIGNHAKRAGQEAAVAAQARQKAYAAGARGAQVEAAATIALGVLHDKYAKKDAEDAKRKQSQDDAAARRAEALRLKIENAGLDLNKSLGALTAAAAKGGNQTLEEQLVASTESLKANYDALIVKANEFAKLTSGRGTIGGRTIDEYKAALATQEAMVENEAKLKVYEQNLADITKARDDKLKDIEDRQRRGQIDPSSAAKEIGEATSTFSTRIQEITDAGLGFARSIAGAAPSAALQAFVEKFSRANSANTGQDQQQAREAAGNVIVQQSQDKLNKLLDQRNALTKSYQDLQKAGLISRQQADQFEQQAFANSKSAILEQVDALNKLIDTLQQMKAISPEAADALRNNLKLTAQDTDYTSDRFKTMKAAVDQTITQDAVNTFENFAKTLADVAVHGGSVTDVFEAIGLGLANLLADVLLTVGKLIIESLILDAVQKATGIPIAALLGAGSGGGGGKLLGVFHSGTDSVGTGSGRTRQLQVTPADVATAPRFHTGTPGVGLAHDEVLSVLKKGEAVIPEDSPDHPSNRGKSTPAGGSKADSIRQVLVVGDDQVAGAMAGSHGEQTVLTHIRRNASTIKQLLG